MPRYAKGSLEDALYAEIVAQANWNDDRPLETVPVPSRPVKEKIIAIKTMCRIHENRWASDDSTLEVIRAIVNE